LVAEEVEGREMDHEGSKMREVDVQVELPRLTRGYVVKMDPRWVQTEKEIRSLREAGRSNESVSS
jgi:hypothetical protein